MESKQQEWTERVQALLCREDWIITNLANAAAAVWEGVGLHQLGGVLPFA